MVSVFLGNYDHMLQPCSEIPSYLHFGIEHILIKFVSFYEVLNGFQPPFFNVRIVKVLEFLHKHILLYHIDKHCRDLLDKTSFEPGRLVELHEVNSLFVFLEQLAHSFHHLKLINCWQPLVDYVRVTFGKFRRIHIWFRYSLSLDNLDVVDLRV